jgi:hypothetical protein
MLLQQNSSRTGNGRILGGHGACRARAYDGHIVTIHIQKEKMDDDIVNFFLALELCPGQTRPIGSQG